MKTRKINIKPFHLRADLRPESLNEETREVEVVFSTGVKGRRFDPDSWEDYWEELILTKETVRLERFLNGAPFLKDHNSSSIDNVIGVVTEARVEKNKLIGKVKFSAEEEADKYFRQVKEGVLGKVSIGYRVHKYEVIKMENEEIDTWRAIDIEPFEASLVTIPFDDDAKLRNKDENDLKLNSCKIIKTDPKKRDQGEISMSKENETKTVETKTPTVNAKEVRSEAIKAERERVSVINSEVKRFNLDHKLAQKLIDDGTEVDEVRTLIMDTIAKRDEQRDLKTQTPEVIDAPKNNVRALSNYLVSRVNHNEELKDGKAFSGMSLIEVAREITGKSGSKTEIAKRAMASSDFMSAVESASSMTLERSYQEARQTFSQFVSRTTLPDYKDYKRINFSASPSMLEVKEGAEYKHGSLGDKQETISLKKYGIIIELTEEAIVNDSLDFLESIANYGAVSARRESEEVYKVLTATHKMSDGKELFHADHGNLITTGAPSETQLDKVYEAFGAFKSQGGKNEQYLNLEPRFLVVGPDNRASAKKIMSSVLSGKSADVNIYSGDLEVIVEGRMNGQGWRVLASPDQIKMIELAYLEGMTGPKLTTWYNEKNDCVSHKIKHIFGVKAINSIGMVKAPNA